jgi:hypothetical protein
VEYAASRTAEGLNALMADPSTHAKPISGFSSFSTSAISKLLAPPRNS